MSVILLNLKFLLCHYSPLIKKSMILNGKYHYICIAPREWEEYSSKNLKQLIVDSCKSHRQQTTCIHGAVTNIAGVSTKLEYYDLKLWMKKQGDNSAYPDQKDYFRMLLDL
ncbi:hypothetical protein 3 [Bracoviriform demolitoris]|uniref:Uncharacterized protein M3 n=1 Tax=Microplitis demolitor bracovirus (isolate Webb) TaxID=654919 RepID=YM3_MDBVW|nr:hypothetical protein 3 [Bracoviriform demolitoris]Q5I133.1 RecName: Full=Uncharacterized protein M3 [Microplitis demolitor bracovirus (isolate Webb)]AAW51799.1 hypothetical protein 3 [Bracoviriform demolitoris]KAG6558513.1 orph-M3 [Microplitis demolitor]